MNEKHKLYIDATEFQRKVLDSIGNGELDNFISSSAFKDNPDARQAIVFGMAFAATLTSQCETVMFTE